MCIRDSSSPTGLWKSGRPYAQNVLGPENGSAEGPFVSQANRRNRDVYRRRGFARIDRRCRRVPAMARANWQLDCSSRSMSKITEPGRDRISDENFAFPKERKEPI